MNKDTFKFFLYRLNKELRTDLYCGFDRPQKRDDDWLEEFLETICSDQFDFTKKTKKSVYTWAVRSKYPPAKPVALVSGPLKAV